MLFAGDPARAEFNAALRRELVQSIVPSMLENGNKAALLVFSPGWDTVLDSIFDGFKLVEGRRPYFEASWQDAEPDFSLPDGFSLRPVDRSLLKSGLDGLVALREEMCSERASVEDFLEHSFGLCPVYGHSLAGWCLSEYNSGDRCEIGIATLEPYQRRGLASQLTRAFLAEAFGRGYRRVGWDCWKRNEASAATAQKAGLHLMEEYPALVAFFAPGD
jgi:GNAT superfamily N-acetyltransferase